VNRSGDSPRGRGRIRRHRAPAERRIDAQALAEAGRRLQSRIFDPRPDPDAAPRRHFIVCGDDPLAHRLVEELVLRYHRPVTVIMTSRLANHGPQIAALAGVRVVEAERLDAAALTAARIGSAEALALVRQDDVGNLHAALQAQELNPQLRLVLRMFNTSFGYAIRRLLKHCQVLSDASIAAPAFVASALGEVAPSYVRVPGRTLYVARRTDAAPGTVVCGLADTSDPNEPLLLPADEARCDLVLAVATGARLGAAAAEIDAGAGGRPGSAADAMDAGDTVVTLPARRVPLIRRPRLGQRLRQLAARLSPTRIFGVQAARTLRIGLLTLLAVLAAGTVLVLLLDRSHLTLWQAAYTTVLSVVSGANPDLHLPAGEQVVQAVLALVGIAMVPVITAAVVEAVVNARLALESGRLRGPIREHVVVIGLGNVGTRVIQHLHTLGVDVVAVDRTDQARGATLARELGIPLILGDASREETLREASLQSARALVATSTDDVVNLEAAMLTRAVNPDARVVLRLFDGDLANRVQNALGQMTSKSVSFLAAPAFATAMLEREVIGTIPVKRRVLLLADVPAEEGSPLVGRSLAEVESGGGVRVVAVDGQNRPAQDTVVSPGQRLIVVATREGLSQMLDGAPEPDDEAPAQSRA
jgi:Trk K+ transport system NAD-binding subunit